MVVHRGKMILQGTVFRRFIAVAAVSLAVFFSSGVLALAQEAQKCVGGVCFEPEYQLPADDVSETSPKSLGLRGVSLFEYWSIDVYSAALYTEPEVDTIDEVLGDTPKYLVLSYHRSLEKQNIVDNSEHILKSNPNNNMSALRERLDRLYENYSDVKDGDKFSMSYIPGKGTTLYFNGQPKETFPGVDFQRAYFGIWLSKSSVDEDFTQELLGGR
jgi:hypothetical protein